MRPRSLLVLAAGAVVVVLLAAAASAGPVRLWTARSAAPAAVATHTAGSTVPAPPPLLLREPGGLSSRTTAVLQILAILFLALVIAAGIPVARALARPTHVPESRAPGGHETAALPDGPELDVVVAVDLAAARAALAEGPPRNAIVACWMQLERDAAGVGLSRVSSETSAEYAARVVARASVDPAPIAELAALYREARFSRHELGDEHRARALASLDRVAAALRAAVRVPA